MQNSTHEAAPDKRCGAHSRVQDRVLAVILLAVTAVFWLDSANIPAAEARMFPKVILGALSVLAILLFARSFTLPREQRSEPVIADRARCALFVGAMILYAGSVAEVGFFTSSAIYMPVAAYLVGLRRHWVNLVVTAVFLVACYLVFVTLFSRPLPAEIVTRFL